MMLHDPDELILQIRAPEIRKYVDESVRAFRAGALRAAVISLWVAVNSDIIGKIRELAAGGDAQAQAEIIQLEKWIQNNEVRSLQSFEENILILARDKFEFLTTIESDELERLRRDRHRCAHPALTPDGSLYDPTPEQIRAHLVIATRALFAHPPVQGRSALAQFKAEVLSQSFPAQLDRVKSYLGSKYFERGKEVLVREIVKLYLQQVLSPIPDVPRIRALHILLAIKEWRFSVYKDVMSLQWARRVSSADEKAVPIIIEILCFDSDLWIMLPSHEQSRLVTFLDQASGEQVVTLLQAMQVENLKESAYRRLSTLPADDLAPALMSLEKTRRELALLAIERFETAETYKAAGQFLDAIQENISVLSEPDLRRIIIAARNNRQIYEANLGIPARLRAFLNATKDTYPGLSSEWSLFASERPETWFNRIRNEIKDMGWIGDGEADEGENSGG